MEHLLESFPDFGYATVSRSGECAKQSYTITWLSKGPLPLIFISNTTSLLPVGSPANVSLVQNGSLVSQFYDLPINLMRTYHTMPQVSTSSLALLL